MPINCDQAGMEGPLPFLFTPLPAEQVAVQARSGRKLCPLVHEEGVVQVLGWDTQLTQHRHRLGAVMDLVKQKLRGDPSGRRPDPDPLLIKGGVLDRAGPIRNLTEGRRRLLDLRAQGRVEREWGSPAYGAGGSPGWSWSCCWWNFGRCIAAMLTIP